MNRIQKLLINEYCDFDDTVLLESPFALVTETGIGIRAVQIALTSSNLILASDYFLQAPFVNSCVCIPCWHIDPEIETLELLSIVPLDYVRMKAYRLNNRKLLDVVLGTGKTYRFEFAGYLLRNLHWNIWRDKIDTLRSHSCKLPRSKYVPRPTSAASGVGTVVAPITGTACPSAHSSETSALWEVTQPSYSSIASSPPPVKRDILRRLAKRFTRAGGLARQCDAEKQPTPAEKCKEFLLQSYPYLSSAVLANE